MLSYSVLQRSSRAALLRHNPHRRLLVAASGEGSALRWLSSGDDNNNSNNNEGKNSNNKSNRNVRNNHNNQGGRNNQRGRRQNKKPSYFKEFMEPAAQGKLQKGHKSGIPKLAGRRPKGHGVRGADPEGILDNEDDFLDFDPVEMMSQRVGKGAAPRKTGSIEDMSPIDELPPEELQKLEKFQEMYASLETMEDDEQYYWREIDFEDFMSNKDREMMEALKEKAEPNEDGMLQAEVDDEMFDYFVENYEEYVPPRQNRGDRGRGRNQEPEGKAEDATPYVSIVDYVMGTRKPEPVLPAHSQATPLAQTGPDMSDFVTSMLSHPTEYATMEFKNPHPESAREPKPDIPKNRLNPSKEFVEGHKRFMYVWGLPTSLIGNKPADFENPVHRMEIQKLVSDLFDVDVDDVSPASLTSAFIGFHSRADQRFATLTGPEPTMIESPIIMQPYQASDKDHLAMIKEAPAGSLVSFENLPAGMTTSWVAKTLFPSGTDAHNVFKVTSDNIRMTSPSSAVIRFESSKVAEAALNSSILAVRLEEFGQHPIRYAKARRELVYTGRHGGPDGTERLREPGPLLIVDGDMPTKNFFVSHADCLHLRNLDPSVTKQDIAKFFQPFCNSKRDVIGSTEFVTCLGGHTTGHAYVGFDELGERERVLEAFPSGRIYGLGGNPVVVKNVIDAKPIQRQQRPTRSVEELLDSLDNWEQYVDPADIDFLLEHGIAKEALDEAFRTIRYHNPTFSSMDQSVRSETLDTEMESGELYKELVQQYIATLKDCIATPENPGPIFESLFAEGEDMDTEVFEREQHRQEELRKRRQIP